MAQEIYAEEQFSGELSNKRRLLDVIRKEAFWGGITISTAVASCVFQFGRYQESIQGMLVIWPTIGLAFALIKISMFLMQWRRLSASSSNSGELYKKRGKIIFNILGLFTLLVTNSILLLTLLDKGVQVWHWTTYVTLALAAGTALVWYPNRHKKWETKLLIWGTGINIIPTYLQGFSYVLRGASGMPGASVVILIGMAYSMYRQSLPSYEGTTRKERREARQKALKAGLHPEVLLPKWDLICQLVAFGLCWGLATFLLPYLGLNWWPLP